MKKRKIFISHYHTDAKALSGLKKKLELMNFNCFLAHEDIEPGEHDLNTIEAEIRNCDAFLYIGSEDANNSSFCQQEIGMAKGLNKEIITTMNRDNPPQGFIGRIQAIRYPTLNDKFFKEMCLHIFEKFPAYEEIKEHLDILKAKGFSTESKKNIVRLERDDWNDHHYLTSFYIYINDQPKANVKISYLKQPTGEHTLEKLPIVFTHLEFPFYSRLSPHENLPKKQADSLRHLLNDTELMPEKIKGKIVTERAYIKSLNRN